jgi:hypothetical protein
MLTAQAAACRHSLTCDAQLQLVNLAMQVQRAVLALCMVCTPVLQVVRCACVSAAVKGDDHAASTSSCLQALQLQSIVMMLPDC